MSCISYAFDICAIIRHLNGDANDGIAAISTRHRFARRRLTLCAVARPADRRRPWRRGGSHAAAASVRTAAARRRAPDGAPRRGRRSWPPSARARSRRCARPRRVGRTAESSPTDERHQQIDVDDRHPVDGEPVPVERAQQPRAVRRRKVHQHVQQRRRRPRRCEQHPERCLRRRPVAFRRPANRCQPHTIVALSQTENDDPERPVRRTAMPVR